MTKLLRKLPLLTAILIMGCYEHAPKEPDAAQLQPIDYDRPVNESKNKPLALQLPDSALFPIVNIYGELRPAVYRTGQAKAGLAFQQTPPPTSASWPSSVVVCCWKARQIGRAHV